MGNTDGKQRSVVDSGSSDTLPILETRVGMRAPASTPSDRSQPMYEQLRRHTFASGHGHGPLPAPPPRPAKGMERSNSLMERQRAPSLHEPHRVSPHFDATATDKLKSRIVHVEPKEGAVGVDMGATVVVQFDGDVKTVNEGKIVEVICTSMQPPVSVRGKTIHNANTNRVEFVPNHSLLPKHNYEVQLAGQAITTTFCSNPANITSHSWSFETQAPPPRNLKVKLSGEEAVLTCHITDEMYFDLYKSLVEWGVRRFGISGEYIREISTTDANGFDLMIQADRDILGISDQQIVVFDVKD